MNKKNLRISVIIPVREGGRYDPVLESLQDSNYPPEHFEILVVEGKSPSYQRNRAAEAAAGDLLYFLDNDASIADENFSLINEHFQNKEIIGLGGPSLTNIESPYIQKAMALAFSSVFGTFRMHHKFDELGRVRKAGEGEIILTNFCIKKEVFLKEKLNEYLYPSEENELVARLVQKRYKMIHDPKMKVFRNQRTTLLEFGKQLFRYGRGRAEQFFEAPRLHHLVFSIPSLFVVYLFSLIFLKIPFLLLPLLCYLFLNLMESTLSSIKLKRIFPIFFLPIAFIIMHTSFGVGYIYGVIKRLLGLKTQPDRNINIIRVKTFDQPLSSISCFCYPHPDWTGSS